MSIFTEMGDCIERVIDLHHNVAFREYPNTLVAGDMTIAMSLEIRAINCFLNFCDLQNLFKEEELDRIYPSITSGLGSELVEESMQTLFGYADGFRLSASWNDPSGS